MGISFGSTGIKPYVGSKEVQEAYVGNKLVYSANPDSTYPPFIINKGYTSLPNVINSPATINEGVGITVYPPKSGSSQNQAVFTLPDYVNNATVTYEINGTEYSAELSGAYSYNQFMLTIKKLFNGTTLHIVLRDSANPSRTVDHNTEISIGNEGKTITKITLTT